MTRTLNAKWMAIPLALCLAATAGCMAHKEMSDTGMDKGMSDAGTMDKGMTDKGMTTPDGKGGM